MKTCSNGNNVSLLFLIVVVCIGCNGNRVNTEHNVVDRSEETLNNKVMAGYQGWFNAPDDGANRGWVHWGRNGFSTDNVTVDMWPDMSEMGPDEKFLASEFNDGNDHYVFSSYNRNTVLRHFQWMQEYGIDGIYLQRFASELNPGSLSLQHRNKVLSHVREGANLYDRKYVIMYDLSGLGKGGTTKVMDDWKYLVDNMGITRNPDDLGYMYHKNKPVVAVWGIGFDDGREYTLEESHELVNFLKNDPEYGGNTVMLGVPSYWRTLSNDSVDDPLLHTIIQSADIISPWSVGRYRDSSGVAEYAENVWIPDVEWCNEYNIDYLPVIWPGFSWRNLYDAELNQIPRNGGQFLWDQVNATINDAGANMLYIAMFDEVDEATAIFKVTNNPPRPDGVDMFVTYDIDGYSLPSDEYLWLVGQAAKGLQGKIPVLETRPKR